MHSSPLRTLMSILLGSTAVLTLGTAASLGESITELQHEAQPNYVRGLGISGDGTTVVGFSNVFGGSSTMSTWSQSGTLTLLNIGIANSIAQAISSDGSTIVGYDYAMGVGDGAFVLKGGTAYYLPELTGITGNGATAVSADGMIVVGYSQATNTEGHAVQWSGANWQTLTDLGTLVPGKSSAASGISGDGSIVVGDGDAADSYEHALFWRGGTIHDLGTTGFISGALGISADGSTIVGSAGGVGFTQSHPTSWTGPTFATETDLGSLGGTLGTAYAVNADGSIIVGESALAGNGSTHAFRYADGSMADLNTLLAKAGVDMTGVSLTQASAVSANGSYIVANDNFNGLSYLTYYSADIGGLTTKAQQQASVDELSRSRQSLAIQNDVYTGILTGDLDANSAQNTVGLLGVVGSAVGGIYGQANIARGWSLSGGLADGTSNFLSGAVGNALIGAAALRYDFDASVAGLQPFVQAGGVPSFHRHFKAVTSMTPVQFQKRVRLQEARRGLSGASTISAVAYDVGYESISQFSRDYRRLFNLTRNAHRRTSFRSVDSFRLRITKRGIASHLNMFRSAPNSGKPKA